MGNMRFKVGDRVRIKSIDWYNENKDEDGDVPCDEYLFVSYMSVFCGKILTIDVDFEDETYLMKEDTDGFVFTDEMIDCLVERNGKTYPYKIGDRVILKGNNRCATITDLKYNSWGNLSYYIKIDNDKDISVDYPTDLLLPHDNMIKELVEEETKPEPKFKVGDSVEVLKSGNTYTISQMVFNGKEFVYALSNNGNTVCWFSEDELIDCKVEEGIEFTEEDKYWCDIMSESDPTTYVLPQGYQFKDENGNVINATKIVLEKKKNEYPKTYEECCYVLGFENTEMVFEDDYRDINPPKEQWKRLGLMNQFNKLLICRDAYWKIAGEEMGLGKPWKLSIGTPIYYIYYNRTVGTIKNDYADDIQGNIILAFPTEEMRDAFYENFKELIESVKELL